MKTRILYVIDGMEFGGGERVFAQLINGLPEDLFATFLATAPSDAFQKAITAKNLTFFPVDFSNRCNAAHVMTLTQIIKKQKIDIVHGQGARAEFFGRLAAKLSGSRYVSTVAMPVEGYDVGFFKRSLYRALDGFSEKFVDYFLVVSAALEKNMITKHGIPAKKVVRIYNGIETEHYRADGLEGVRHRVRREYAIHDGEVLIGSVGRLVWQKGFEYLLRAMPAILQEFPNVRFILVGDGPLRQELENLATSLGVRDKLIFTGYSGDVRSLLAALDIIVIPSVLEGFPMITLEAMAMEKPIVATAIDGINEQIENKKEGLLVAAKNPLEIARALKRLLDDRNYTLLLGKNGRKKVIREFSVEKMITKTMDVYGQLCRS